MPNTPLDLPREKPSQQSNASDKLAASFNGPKPKADAPILPSVNGTDCRQRKDSGQNTEAMVRLLNKTNSQMEAPETKTRRNVMTQLRSAFAVTQADQTHPTVAVTAPPQKPALPASDRALDRQTAAAAQTQTLADTRTWTETQKRTEPSSAAVLRLPQDLRVLSQTPNPARSTTPTSGQAPALPPNGGVVEVTTDTSLLNLP